MSNGLFFGERTSGQEARTQNVTATMAIANVVKSFPQTEVGQKSP